jgi:GTP-binding protein HflX
METELPAPRAILVGIQIAGVDDVAHAASIEELGRLVRTLGYEVVGVISQKREVRGDLKNSRRSPAEPASSDRRHSN